MYNKRIQTIQEALRRKKLDALLVGQPQNRRYLSGYAAEDTSIAESSGFLLVPLRKRPLLLTDFRYKLQAEEEAPDYEVALYQKGFLALLATLLPRLGIKRLGFESHYFLHSAALKLIDLLRKKGGQAVATTGLVEACRVAKSSGEIERIERAVQLNEKVFETVFKEMRPGRTEREIALQIELLTRQLGAEAVSFPPIVAAGPNGAKPHAVPTYRPIREGEPVIVDMGCILDGYCSDMTRTVVLGTPDDKTLNFIRLVRKAQKEAMAGIKAGLTCRQADQLARKVITAAGYGHQFGHGLGHGVGLAVHESPSLSRRSRKKLQAGMVVTVEPGIYLPDWGGVRLENMVVVEEDGCRNLNTDTTWLDV
ncbi:MAG: Xaa-Pro peptidase family protein [Deltaproteobacteria bacterium]